MGRRLLHHGTVVGKSRDGEGAVPYIQRRRPYAR